MWQCEVRIGLLLFLDLAGPFSLFRCSTLCHVFCPLIFSLSDTMLATFRPSESFWMESPRPLRFPAFMLPALSAPNVNKLFLRPSGRLPHSFLSSSGVDW